MDMRQRKKTWITPDVSCDGYSVSTIAKRVTPDKATNITAVKKSINVLLPYRFMRKKEPIQANAPTPFTIKFGITGS
jgi:hypothetical protein